MAWEQKVGTGTLSESKYYEEGGSKPKHWGSILLDRDLIDTIVANGSLLPISGWDKKGEGWSLISLTVDEYQFGKRDNPKQQDGFQQAHKAVDNVPDIPDTDVPF